MHFLVDTCTALFYWNGSAELSEKARQTMRDPANILWFHQISFFEITLKYSIGKLRLKEAPSTLVPKALSAYRMRFTRLSNRDVSKLEDLPFHHRDPFDRVLIARALNEKMSVITPDGAFSDYGLRVIW